MQQNDIVNVTARELVYLDDGDRVRKHTRPRIRDRLDRDTIARLDEYSSWPEEKIARRIAELDREWDTERTVEAATASLIIGGLAAGARDRRLLWLPALTAVFLLQHALQGWCPPVSLMRRFGLRTRSEIDVEKFALKAIRGDYDGDDVENEEEDVSDAPELADL